MKLYIAVLKDVPDFMAPTLVAHSVLAAHYKFKDDAQYQKWFETSFKKCVVKVNEKEFFKISQLPNVHLGHENSTLGGIKSCAIPLPCEDSEIPNVLRFAKLWAPEKN